MKVKSYKQNEVFEEKIQLNAASSGYGVWAVSFQEKQTKPENFS